MIWLKRAVIDTAWLALGGFALLLWMEREAGYGVD